MPNQNLLDKTYMKMACCWATLSKAKRKQVGCLIVKDGTIISDGYNGTPSGFDNECEWEQIVDTDEIMQPAHCRLVTKSEVLHAEENAITKLARSNESGEGSTAFITHVPCLSCAKLLYSSGIVGVYYTHPYKNTEGLDFLNECMIKVNAYAND